MQRTIFLDYIRVLACVMVVVIHSPCSSEVTDGFWTACSTIFGIPCNGLFFMVSGYLLLPLKDETGVFLKKRFSKVVFPTLFWTFFYIGINSYIYNIKFEELWYIIFSIPFSRQGTGWLWFMYVMMGLYLIAPIISSWIKNVSRREFTFYIVLCLITSVFPLLDHVVEIIPGTYNILYYFAGYIGYFLLGAYLKKYPIRLNTIGILSLYFIPIVMALLSKARGYDIVYAEFSNYLSFFTISMCISIFCFFMKVIPIHGDKAIIVKVVQEFSKCSFGIYLIHHFVIHQIIDREFLIMHYGTLLQIVISAILTIIISFIIVYTISWLPYSQYIIGYKQKG